MTNNYSFVPTAPVRHSVEIYTARFLVQGAISGPYRRTSDVLNRKDDNFLSVEDVSISPVGQGAEPQKLATTLMLGRQGIHFVALAVQPSQLEGAEAGDTEAESEERKEAASSASGLNLMREYVVSKKSHACYVLTDTFIIHGRCYLREGNDLRNILEMGDAFIPISDPVIHMASRVSAAPWQRDLVIVNREKIEVMYLVG